MRRPEFGYSEPDESERLILDVLETVDLHFLEVVVLYRLPQPVRVDDFGEQSVFDVGCPRVVVAPDDLASRFLQVLRKLVNREP